MPVVFPALRVELAPQLGEQQSEVLLVLGALDISFEPALHREFPIDIDAI